MSCSSSYLLMMFLLSFFYPAIVVIVVASVFFVCFTIFVLVVDIEITEVAIGSHWLLCC